MSDEPAAIEVDAHADLSRGVLTLTSPQAPGLTRVVQMEAPVDLDALLAEFRADVAARLTDPQGGDPDA